MKLLALDEGAIVVSSAEIYIDATDPVAIKREELRVAEFRAFIGEASVSDERLVSLLENPLNEVRQDALAVGPAPFEIGGLVDLVVIRARECEILGQQPLDNVSIFRFVGSKTSANDVRFASGRHLGPLFGDGSVKAWRRAPPVPAP